MHSCQCAALQNRLTRAPAAVSKRRTQRWTADAAPLCLVCVCALPQRMHACAALKTPSLGGDLCQITPTTTTTPTLQAPVWMGHPERPSAAAAARRLLRPAHLRLPCCPAHPCRPCGCLGHCCCRCCWAPARVLAQALCRSPAACASSQDRPAAQVAGLLTPWLQLFPRLCLPRCNKAQQGCDDSACVSRHRAQVCTVRGTGSTGNPCP